MPAKKSDVETIKLFLDDLWNQAHGMLKKGRKSTEKVAQSAKAKMDLYLLNGKKDDLYQKLGEAFYLSSKNKKTSPKKQQAVLSILKEISDIERHEKSLKKELGAAHGKVANKTGRRGRPPKVSAPVKKKRGPKKVAEQSK